MSEISRGLKILARELECPVVALAQLNRQLEYRQDKRPMLADLRESGGLEQDADVVDVHLPRRGLQPGVRRPTGKAEVIIAKHRNGPTGKAELAFIPDRAEFVNMAREHVAGVADVVRGADGVRRCSWGTSPPEYAAYHDDEWGRPVTDDVRLYEKLCLEGFQSGLSWLTILRKRDAFRRAFAGFDPAKVARFGARDVQRLLGDAGIVRHRGKIEAAINNAGATLEVQRDARVARGARLVVRSSRSAIGSTSDAVPACEHAGVDRARRRSCAAEGSGSSVPPRPTPPCSRSVS